MIFAHWPMPQNWKASQDDEKIIPNSQKHIKPSDSDYISMYAIGDSVVGYKKQQDFKHSVQQQNFPTFESFLEYMNKTIHEKSVGFKDLNNKYSTFDIDDKF